MNNFREKIIIPREGWFYALLYSCDFDAVSSADKNIQY
jgi:hypothetical protein